MSNPNTDAELFETEFSVKFKELKKLRNNHHIDEPEFDERVEQLAADTYAHNSATGWCCACEADIAFLDREKAALLDELEERVANPGADNMTMEDFRGRADTVARGTYNFIQAQRAKLTKGAV